MADAASRQRAASPLTVNGFLRATEIDTRMLGMLGALAVIWIGFHLASGGTFLTPRNLWNLSVQSASIAVMATGMVLVIVTRNIDLSVGSMLGFIGMTMGVMQAEWLPTIWGYDHPLTWIVALAFGVGVGVAIGALHGWVIAYLGVPAFIVTLGGLLAWRGGAWWVTSGRTVAPMDGTFALIGGGVQGSIGAAASWAIALAACAAILAGLWFGRLRRRSFGFPLRPLWAEGVLGLLGCGAVLAAVAVFNTYPWPSRVAERWAEANGTVVPEGGFAHGLAIPVLVALAVGVGMTFLATRTRFGRYVFAIGGNPEAAELAGVDVAWVKMKVFMLMGGLVALGAAISTARLNAATNAQGQLDELYVIAAAVIGGTSLAGGAGTIAGAMIGAVVMQSLQSGMVLMGLDTPLQNIVVGLVLVVAVWVDTMYRGRKA
ncbi:sugar ABC transporter permease [Rubrimonas cliftonensis]|uniref:Xylose transport system permease protein XylH n=1 Tax=Rubrimonas cliftonensis TaxID=89524 RepID=A0A1H4G0U9_9RHOB|nr:sugar ABC transporter permease [Rubrimonas cliftonensis]SEB03154.1 D-xylose transport system permease protein [Rubrimonas cliftonensis]